MIFTRPKYDRVFRSLTSQQQSAVNAAVSRLDPCLDGLICIPELACVRSENILNSALDWIYGFYSCRKAETSTSVLLETTIKCGRLSVEINFNPRPKAG